MFRLSWRFPGSTGKRCVSHDKSFFQRAGLRSAWDVHNQTRRGLAGLVTDRLAPAPWPLNIFFIFFLGGGGGGLWFCRMPALENGTRDAEKKRGLLSTNRFRSPTPVSPDRHSRTPRPVCHKMPAYMFRSKMALPSADGGSYTTLLSAWAKMDGRRLTAKNCGDVTTVAYASGPQGVITLAMLPIWPTGRDSSSPVARPFILPPPPPSDWES